MMVSTIRKVGATAFATAALFGTVAAAPAGAQGGPVITGGLVNITVVDLLNNNTILSNNDVNLGVALNAAANVCGVSVNVLAQQLGSFPVSCDNGAQQATITQLA
jgi:hypothetical protein